VGSQGYKFGVRGANRAEIAMWELRVWPGESGKARGTKEMTVRDKGDDSKCKSDNTNGPWDAA
jgi:hypothetical protein